MSNIDLARRAVACKHWRWTRGMSAICDNGWRVLRGTDTWEWDDHGSWPGGPPFRDFSAALNREILPDLTDAATLGCLLALVRKAWGDDGICPDFNKMRWTILTWDCCAIGDGGTEAEALVAALEVAT